MDQTKNIEKIIEKKNLLKLTLRWSLYVAKLKKNIFDLIIEQTKKIEKFSKKIKSRNSKKEEKWSFSSSFLFPKNGSMSP